MAATKKSAAKKKQTATGRTASASQGRRKAATKKSRPTRKSPAAKKKVAKKSAPRKRKSPTRKSPAAKKKVAKKSGPKKRKSPASSKRKLYSIRELSLIFGVAQSRIREHIEKHDGPVEQSTRQGRAARLDSAKWFEHFQKFKEGSANRLQEAKTSRAETEALSHRLEYEKAAGLVVDADFVVKFFSRVLVEFSIALDSIAGKSAEGNSRLRSLFLIEVRNARKAIGKQIESYIKGLINGAEFNLTATRPDLGGMGGSEKDTTKG